MAITVSPTTARPTHHLKLTDGVSSLGLVLCDAQGNPDKRSIRRDPYPRSSLKTYSGNQTYSDLEPPWTPIMQEDWSGGQSWRDFDSDATRFGDGSKLWITKQNEVLPAGMEARQQGVVTGDIHLPWNDGTGSLVSDHVHRKWYKPASWIGYKFTAVASYTTATILTILRRVGTPNALTISIYSDNSGVPNLPLETVTVAYSDLEEYVETQIISTIGEALTASTVYWILISTSADTAASYWEVLCNYATDANAYTSPTNSVWSSSSYGILYYLRAVQPASKLIYFEYKGQLFAVMTHDDMTAPHIYMNGEQGVASGGSTTTLEDVSASWTVNRWAGCWCKLFVGPGAGGKTNYAYITSNTATALTLGTSLDEACSAGTEYSIVGSDYWSEATGHGITTGITDVLSVNYIAYFCLGDGYDMKHARRASLNDSGTATAGGASTLTDSGKAWSSNYWAGGHIIITSGTGSGQTRKVASNTATEITVSSAWATQPDATSAYTVRLYAMSIATETGNKYYYLQEAPEGDKVVVWGAHRYVPAQVAKADSVDGSGSGAIADLSFATAIPVGDNSEAITGLTMYGDDGRLYVLKEGSIWYVYNNGTSDIIGNLVVHEMANVRDIRNGSAHLAHNVYLYFSLQDGLERWYSGSLDNVGPDLDEGLPSSRRGCISALAGYPGKFFAAVDGGTDRYSCILMYNGSGWVEMYRAPKIGQRIRSLHIQSMPADAPDRLWFDLNGDAICLPIILDPYNANQTYLYPYQHEAVLISAWHAAGLQEVQKYWQTIKPVLDGSGTEYYVDYQKYGDTSWTPLTSELTTSGLTFGVSSTRLRYRLRIISEANNTAERLRGILLECATRVPVKYTDTFSFRIADQDIDLQGQADDEPTADDKFTLLETWAGSATPITMSAWSRRFNGKAGFLDPYSLKVISTLKDGKTDREIYICQATLIEI